MQVIDSLKAGHQAMVFVHSRKDTGKTGRTIIQTAQNSSDTAIFDVTEHPQWAFVSRDVKKSRNKCVIPHPHDVPSSSAAPSEHWWQRLAGALFHDPVHALDVAEPGRSSLSAEC